MRDMKFRGTHKDTNNLENGTQGNRTKRQPLKTLFAALKNHDLFSTDVDKTKFVMQKSFLLYDCAWQRRKTDAKV